jgi:methylated-DNA-[protein]-cysteine S-methyltransferase
MDAAATTDAASLRVSFSTPWGRGALVIRGGRLLEVRLPDPGKDVRCTPSGERAALEEDRAAAEHWVHELEAFFAGAKLSWTAEELPLDSLAATPFRLAVYRALLQVPAGVTVSYGTLADLSGYPGAARAVGTAMATNPLPILIPCHRVVRSDGAPGRYGTCDALKPWLLDHEGRVDASAHLEPPGAAGGEPSA